jgi:hypothetical protein
MKRVVPVVVLSLIFVNLALAADFWNSKPYSKWSNDDVERMRTDSPWAHTTTLRTGTLSGRGSNPNAVNDSAIEPRITYAVAIRSALPVRQANVRLRALTDKYDKMDPAAKQAFDAKWNAYLDANFPDTIVIGVIYQSNVPGIDVQLSTYFQRQTLEDMKSTSALILPDGKRLPPTAFVAGAHEMQIGFPRPADLPPGSSFTIEFKHPDMPDQPSRQIASKFSLKSMLFNGAVAY